MARTRQTIDENYAAFEKELPELMLRHPGRFALMRNAGIVDFFDTARNAVIAGEHLYEDDEFSIQEVTMTPVNLGRYSCD